MRIVQGVADVPGPHRVKALVGLAFGDDAVAATFSELPHVRLDEIARSARAMNASFRSDLYALEIDRPAFPSGELVVAVILMADLLPELDPRMVNAALDAAEGVLFADRRQIRMQLSFAQTSEAAAQTIVIAAPFRGGE